MPNLRIGSKHFQTTIETQNNIIIEVTPLFELNDEAIQKIANSKAFTFRESAGMSKMRLMVSNENGDLGIVNNPFDEVYSNDFTFTLNQVLVDSFVRTNTGPWPGMDNISIPGIDFAGVSSSKQIFYLRIPFNRSELQPR